MRPWQHALDDGLAAVGELPDHRGVALGPPDDRVADRGPVAGVSVRVQEQMEPPAPAGGARTGLRRSEALSRIEKGPSACGRHAYRTPGRSSETQPDEHDAMW